MFVGPELGLEHYRSEIFPLACIKRRESIQSTHEDLLLRLLVQSLLAIQDRNYRLVLRQLAPPFVLKHLRMSLFSYDLNVCYPCSLVLPVEETNLFDGKVVVADW
jgi:hypothetical protein